MSERELLDSGLIELYCLGMASGQESALVEEWAGKSELIAREINENNKAIEKYASLFATEPPPNLKRNVLREIHNLSNDKIAPVLDSRSTVGEWLRWLEHHHYQAPKDFEGLHISELPGNENRNTFALWVESGSSIKEEVHEDIHEYIFILSGSCEMTIGGAKSAHKKGDLIVIPPGIYHSAIITSEVMQAVVQRRAA